MAERLMMVEVVPASKADKTTKRLEDLRFKKGRKVRVSETGIFPEGSLREPIEVVITRLTRLRRDVKYVAGMPGLPHGWGFGNRPHRALRVMGSEVSRFQADSAVGAEPGSDLALSKAVVATKFNSPKNSEK